MSKPTRGDLLEKYCKREPTGFIQFDVHKGKPNDSSDCIMQFDKRGFCCQAGTTHELMFGPAEGVRVLINPAATAKQAADMLQEVRAWIINKPKVLKRMKEELIEIKVKANEIPF